MSLSFYDNQLLRKAKESLSYVNIFKALRQDDSTNSDVFALTNLASGTYRQNNRLKRITDRDRCVYFASQ